MITSMKYQCSSSLSPLCSLSSSFHIHIYIHECISFKLLIVITPNAPRIPLSSLYLREILNQYRTIYTAGGIRFNEYRSPHEAPHTYIHMYRDYGNIDFVAKLVPALQRSIMQFRNIRFSRKSFLILQVVLIFSVGIFPQIAYRSERLKQ